MIKDIFPKYEGKVTWGFSKEDEYNILGTNHNTITYSGADIMAKLLGGNQQYKISHMGFIFGTTSKPLFSTNPERSSSWEGLNTELRGGGTYNISITPLATAPIYTTSKSVYPEAEYKHNTTTFSGATSDSIAVALRNGPGSEVKSALEDGDYIYQTLLLANVPTISGEDDYKVFARGSLLKDGIYPQKIKGWGVSVQWDIIFY